MAWILISYLKNLLTGSLSPFHPAIPPRTHSCVGSGVNLSKVGKWAIVTGASEGIGAAYCEGPVHSALISCPLSITA